MFWHKLSDRIFFRTMFTSFGIRPVDRSLQPPIHYFRYEIGPYRSDYLLHFRKEPQWDLYKHEIFNKLSEVTGYDVARYLNFHYEPYADKADFLRFLRYETTERIRQMQQRIGDWRIKLEMVLVWVEEQERALDRPSPYAAPGGTAVEPMRVAITPTQTAVAPLQAPSTSPPGKKEMELTEASLKEMVQSYSGRIEVTYEQSLDRFIQLLLLVRDLRAPGKTFSPVFRQFSTTDIASILHQFAAFKDMKVNTLQKRIMECNKDLRSDDPKTAQLNTALTEFFYPVFQ